MVYVEEFYKYKLENKYTDLLIRINDHDIHVHKILICEKSPYIKNALKYNYNNIINLTLPDDTSLESFNVAINFIYGHYTKTNNVTFVVNTFHFLGINKSYILNYLTETIPINKELSLDHKNAIINTQDENLVKFYGVELLNDVEIHEDEFIFGRSNKMIDYFNSIDDNNFDLDNSEWHYFTGFEHDDDKEFNALGYKWSIFRQTLCYEEKYDSIVLELKEESKAKFRIVLILFTEQSVRKRYFLCDCSDEKSFKILNGKNRIHKCGINIIPTCHERVRISLFLQKI